MHCDAMRLQRDDDGMRQRGGVEGGGSCSLPPKISSKTWPKRGTNAKAPDWDSGRLWYTYDLIVHRPLVLWTAAQVPGEMIMMRAR
jgi:hypothetical protein